jgi:hypothetical protein
MCESDEPHPYPLRSFTYRNEQVRADEERRGIVNNLYQITPVYIIQQ